MRGTAALAVVAWHAGGGRVVPSAYLAVDLFFCISGFVLAHAYVNAQMSFAAFVKARLVRLYPLYLLGFLLILALKPIQWPNILSGLAFLPAVQAERGDYWPYPLNVAAWSLLFELIINFLWFPMRRVRWPALAGAAAVGLVSVAALISVVGTVDVGWKGVGFFVQGMARVVFPFLAGSLLHRIWAYGKLTIALPFWLGPAIMCAIFVMPGSRPIVDTVGVALLVPLAVWLGATAVEPPRLSGAFHGLGEASYPIYMLHGTVLILLQQIIPPIVGQPYIVTAVAVPLLLWLSWVALRYYDRPVRLRLARNLRQRREVDAASGSGSSSATAGRLCSRQNEAPALSVEGHSTTGYSDIARTPLFQRGGEDATSSMPVGGSGNEI